MSGDKVLDLGMSNFILKCEYTLSYNTLYLK